MALVGDSSLPVEAYDTHTAESAVVSWFACYSAANSGGELILPPTTRPIWKDLGGMAGNLFIYFLAKETHPDQVYSGARPLRLKPLRARSVVGSSLAPLQSPGSERPLRSDYGSWASGRPSDSGSHPCESSSSRGATTSGCPLRNNTEHRPPVVGSAPLVWVGG